MKIIMLIFLIPILIIVSPFSLTAMAQEALIPSLVKIVDGDTIKVLLKGKETKVRFYGIDCPERDQPFGEYATGATAMALIGKESLIIPLYQDRYGRTVAIIKLVDGFTLQEWLVRIGAAWVWPEYCERPECEEWLRLQEESRECGFGLWSQKNSVPPWEWRRR